MQLARATTVKGQLDLGLGAVLPEPTPVPRRPLERELAGFAEFGKPTTRLQISLPGIEVQAFVNEFWTARQRQASSLHEVSYRACFKPQLPRFFIERLTRPGDVVCDPFMGRGTTVIEAALLGRVPFGNDANPLSTLMTRPRLDPPRLEQIEERLNRIDFQQDISCREDLRVFYHPDTLRAICSLRHYFLTRRKKGSLDGVDEWIWLVALNRLTGHSNGFFSVYTLPPNQAVSVKSQIKINEKRKQSPPRRDVPTLIYRKSRQLLSDLDEAARQRLQSGAAGMRLLTGPADASPGFPDSSVSLVVTSPPFLNVVQYATDNWLRCWFAGIDAKDVRLTTPTKLSAWAEQMTKVFRELKRVLRPGGHIAFEVGEVHGGKTRLEETVIPCGIEAGLKPVLVLINDQKFTKTANCWGIDNMARGTNTNRIVLFRKAGS